MRQGRDVGTVVVVVGSSRRGRDVDDVALPPLTKWKRWRLVRTDLKASADAEVEEITLDVHQQNGHSKVRVFRERYRTVWQGSSEDLLDQVAALLWPRK